MDFDGDHRIVDEKPERDDERAERDALEVDVGEVHRHEDDGEHQRDGAGHDRAGAQSEAQQADRHHDGDRLPQRLHELADRMVHDLRLIVHQVCLDPDRQARGDLGHRALDVAAEREHVAALAHRDAEADRGLAVDPEHRLRRIRIAALDGAEIGQAEQAAIEREVHPPQIRLGREASGHPQKDRLVLRSQHAGRSDAVLRLQRADELGAIDAEPGQLLQGELQVQPFVLRADGVDLHHVLDPQQA